MTSKFNPNMNITRYGQSFQQRPPYQQQRQVLNRTFLKDKFKDPLAIASILLKFTEGNILDIKKIMGEFGITINELVDENGKSVLHLILENDNLSKEHKLELIRFLKTQGPLIMNYDSNNITPLHIATRLQLTEIVNELLKAKHDPNAQDKSLKTPLHYAINGIPIKKPLPEKELISEKKKVKIHSNLIEKLTKEIFTKFVTQRNPFIDNIINTINSIDDIYYSEINEIINDTNINKKINDIQLAQDIKQSDKDIKIQELTNQKKKTLIDFIRSKLTSTLNLNKYEQNSTNGWSPNGDTDLPRNKIIPNNNLRLFISDLEDSEKTSVENLDIKLKGIREQIVKNNTYFTNLNGKFKNIANHGLWIANFYERLAQIIEDSYTVDAGAGHEPLIVNPLLQNYTDLNIEFNLNEFNYDNIVNTDVQIQPEFINSDIINEIILMNCSTNNQTDYAGANNVSQMLQNTDILNSVSIEFNKDYNKSKELIDHINSFISVQTIPRVYVRESNGRYLDAAQLYARRPQDPDLFLELNQNYITEIQWLLQNCTDAIGRTLYDDVIIKAENFTGLNFMPYYALGNNNFLFTHRAAGLYRNMTIPLYDLNFVANNPRIPGAFPPNHLTVFFNLYEKTNTGYNKIDEATIYTNKYHQDLYKFSFFGVNAGYKFYNIMHLNPATRATTNPYEPIAPIQTKINIPNSYYFTKKYSIILAQHTLTLNSLNTDLNNIITLIKSNRYDATYNNIYDMLSLLIIRIIEAIINLKSLQDETDLIKIRLSHISNKLLSHIETVRSLLNPTINAEMVEVNKIFNNNPIDILYVEYKKVFDDLLSDINKNLNSTIVQTFSNYADIYNSLNNIIDIYNRRSFVTYVNKYFNNLNFNQFVNAANPNTELITNVYKYVIKSIPKFSSSLNDLDSLFKLEGINPYTNIRDNATLKSKFIENFLIQFLNDNYNLLYTNAQAPLNAKIGYAYNLNTLFIYDPASIALPKPNLKYNATSNHADLDDSDATYIGNVGYITPVQMAKTGMALPITSYDLDRFYTIYKNIFIKYIINDINTNNIQIITPGTLQDVINELKDNNDLIKSSDQDYGIIYITLATILDKLYTFNFEHLINIVSDDIIKKLGPAQHKLVLPDKIDKAEIYTIDYDILNKAILRNIRKLITNNNLDLSYLDDITYKKEYKNIYLTLPSSILDNSNRLYYVFNPEIIQLLLNSGSENHIRDKDGRNPFVNAVINSNVEAVEELLKQQGISVSTQKSIDNYGFTPLDIAINQFEDIIGNFDFTFNGAFTNISDEINEEIKTKTQITHIMRYNELIFPMLIYIINHHLYNIGNTYTSSNWTPKINNDFHIKVNGGFIDKIQLLDILNSNTEKLYHFKDIDNLNQTYNDKYEKAYEDVSKRRNYRKKLTEEYKHYNPSKFRKIQIKGQQIDLRRNMRQEIQDKKFNFKRNKNLINRQNTQYIETLRANIDTNLDKTTNLALELYDSIYNEILDLNGLDGKTYTELWRILLENIFMTNSSKHDPSQIITNCIKKLIDLQQLKFNKSDKNVIDSINLISEYLKIIKTVINNYFMKTQLYEDDNQELTLIINIIIHIIKSTISLNLYNVIQKLLKLELENKLHLGRPIDQRILDINDEIRNILTDKIREYIFNILPEKCVKVALGIFESEEDPDKQVDIQTLLLEINKMLIANPMIKSDSNVIKTLENGIYPYFYEYLQLNIKQMKKITDSYFGMIHTLSKKIEILQLILHKAVNE